MIGDNLYIQVELNRAVEFVLVKNTISALFKGLEITVPGSFYVQKMRYKSTPGKRIVFQMNVY